MPARRARAEILSGEQNSERVGASPVVRIEEQGLVVGVRVTPSAPRTAVQGLYGDRLKVCVAAPPEAGRANRALVEALSGWLGLPRTSIQVIAGHTARDKMVAFAGIEEEELRKRLAVLAQGGAAGKGR